MSKRLGVWYFIDLGTVDYRSAWSLQKNILEAKKKEEHFADVVLFLEHFPVFTMGRRGGIANLRVSESVIRDAGIEIFPVERGGDITYHGPGQLVAYPIIHLQRNGLKVVEYVEKLEEIMIQTAFRWNITATRNVLNRGVWVENRKLGSIGIAIKRGISFHGLALNINLSLKPYEWINPCGLTNISMTSMVQEASEEISPCQVTETVKQYMSDIFRINWQPISLSRINSLIKSVLN